MPVTYGLQIILRFRVKYLYLYNLFNFFVILIGQILKII